MEPIEDLVYEPTEDELRVAVRDALEYSGHTYQELQEMAEARDFDDLRSRRVWVAVSGMARFAPSHA